MNRREGFTLLEMTIVLAIIGIASALIVPALVDLGRTPPHRTADVILHKLEASRALAIGSHVTVTMIIDPKTNAYRVDSLGLGTSGEVAEGKLELGNGEMMVSDLTRLHFRFSPSGAAFADTVRVRGIDSSLVVTVDSWTGVARAAK